MKGDGLALSALGYGPVAGFSGKNYLNFISHKGQHITWSAEQLNTSYLLTYLLLGSPRALVSLITDAH